MLTASEGDPRRANWLTLGGSADDFCWPDARPPWELEAEILRLTTRLMMRERELRQAKNQLKAQANKAQQQAATWRKRMEEKEEQMRVLLVQKDAEMQNIVSQLLLFEAELRQEQRRIEDLLTEKDARILSQQEQMGRLKEAVRRDGLFQEKWNAEDSIHATDGWKTNPPSHSPKQDSRKTADSRNDTADRDHSSWTMEDFASDSVDGECHGEDDWKINSSIHPHEKDSRSARDSRKETSDRDHSSKSGVEDCIPDLVHVAYHGVGDWKRNPLSHSPERDSRKTPDLRKETSDKDHYSLRMEDSIADSVHVGYHAMNDWKKTNLLSHSPERDSRKTPDMRKDSEDGDHSPWRIEECVPDSVNVDYYFMDDSTQTSRKVDHGSRHPSEKESRKTQDPREDFADRSHSAWRIEDFVENPVVVDSQDAVRKLKNGLTKIRAIHDVTNVKSLGSSCDILPVEKKKVPSRPPQKMKDLKAKRINHHKVHRSVVNEIGGQAIL